MPTRRTFLRGVLSKATAGAAAEGVFVMATATSSDVQLTRFTRNLLRFRGPVVRAEDTALVGDGVADDTQSLQKALDAAEGGTLHLENGKTYRVRSVSVPAMTRVVGNRARLQAAPGSTGDAVVRVATGCTLTTLAVDGGGRGEGGPSCVKATGRRLTFSDLTLVNSGGQGLGIENASDFVVRRVSVKGVVAQGIVMSFSERGTVTDCTVVDADQGIQFWGGDSADASTALGVNDLTITGNTVRDVDGGGIWGSRGTGVVISGNTVERCGDVGIDFEGCSRCTAEGNTVTDAVNSALAVFYASKDCTFTKNTVTQGPAMGAGFRSFGLRTSRRITVDGNRFTLQDGMACYFDENYCEDSSFSQNTAMVKKDGVYAIRNLHNDGNTFVGNRLVNSAPTCISNEGGSSVTIQGNQMTFSGGSSAVAPGQGGAVFQYYAGGEFPGQRCTITQNVAKGYDVGVCDANWADDKRSFNVIQDNAVESVVHYGSSDYRGVIRGNRTPDGSGPAVVTALG